MDTGVTNLQEEILKMNTKIAKIQKIKLTDDGKKSFDSESVVNKNLNAINKTKSSRKVTLRIQSLDENTSP